MKVSNSVIDRIARQEARNVTSSGATGGESHNFHVIKRAIQTALNHKPRKKRK